MVTRRTVLQADGREFVYYEGDEVQLPVSESTLFAILPTHGRVGYVRCLVKNTSEDGSFVGFRVTRAMTAQGHNEGSSLREFPGETVLSTPSEFCPDFDEDLLQLGPGEEGELELLVSESFEIGLWATSDDDAKAKLVAAIFEIN